MLIYGNGFIAIWCRIMNKLRSKLLRILKRSLRKYWCKHLFDKYFLVYNDQIKEWLIVPRLRVNMYYYGHEERVVELIKNNVEKDTIFIDVGAFIGFYSILAGKMGGIVYSFEPDPRSYTLLELNLLLADLNERVYAYNNAVGNTKGYVNLKLASTFAESSITEYLNKRKVVNVIKVPITTIDDFILDQSIRKVDIIKIDVEGYGAKVINGALITIKTYRPNIIFEVHRFGNDTELAKVLDLKNKYQYEIKILEYRNYRNFIIYLYQ